MQGRGLEEVAISIYSALLFAQEDARQNAYRWAALCSLKQGKEPVVRDSSGSTCSAPCKADIQSRIRKFCEYGPHYKTYIFEGSLRLLD